MITNININPSILTRFATLIERDRLAHAYMFVGPKFVGKGETAMEIAKLVNLPEPDMNLLTDENPLCRRISSGNHPDVFVVGGEEPFEAIKIEQIRHFISRMHLRPYEAKKKVLVIKNIERMTTEGANALLKTLEEPTKGSLIILTTSVPEANLDTIKSRCHQVRFFPLSQQVLADRLQSEFKVDQGDAHFLAGFTDGCLSKATELNNKRFFERKDAVLEHFLFDRDPADFIKKLTADKEKTREALDILMSFFRDVALIKNGCDPAELVHQDRLNEVEQMAQHYAMDDISEIIDAVVATTHQLNENLNVKLSLNLLVEQIRC